MSDEGSVLGRGNELASDNPNSNSRRANNNKLTVIAKYGQEKSVMRSRTAAEGDSSEG